MGGALEKLIGIHVVPLRQLTAVCDIAPDQLYGLGEAPLQPGQFRFMGVKVRVVSVSPDVVPVDVGGHRRHRPPGQWGYHLGDIAYAKPCINE